MNRIGSLCTGYGGLDMAVRRVFGGELSWYSEFDKHPSTLLAQRFPGVPNLGDLKQINWDALRFHIDDIPGVSFKIDILTGGYPCQPFSTAGKRLGEDDPRHLWPYVRSAIRTLRPRISFLENVAGHRSKGFDAVLKDCAEDGMDVRWTSVRASDVGAPHRRERLFFVVTNPEDNTAWDGQERRDKAGCDARQPSQCSGDPSLSLSRYNREVDWDVYAPAIRRWERELGRPAPTPTEPNRVGNKRMTMAFDEWLMGLPEGWVTDLPIPYEAKIKLLGNGVVPQQAEFALRTLISNGV